MEILGSEVLCFVQSGVNVKKFFGRVFKHVSYPFLDPDPEAQKATAKKAKCPGDSVLQTAAGGKEAVMEVEETPQDPQKKLEIPVESPVIVPEDGILLGI